MDPPHGAYFNTVETRQSVQRIVRSALGGWTGSTAFMRVDTYVDVPDIYIPLTALTDLELLALSTHPGEILIQGGEIQVGNSDRGSFTERNGTEQ